MSNNQWGLDQDYFEKELQKLTDNASNHRPEEMQRALLKLAEIARPGIWPTAPVPTPAVKTITVHSSSHIEQPAAVEAIVFLSALMGELIVARQELTEADAHTVANWFYETYGQDPRK